jgi:hypothetical protein
MDIKLCKGHSNGLRLVRLFNGRTVFYKGTPIEKLKIIVVEKDNCVQCKAIRKGVRK